MPRRRITLRPDIGSEVGPEVGRRLCRSCRIGLLDGFGPPFSHESEAVLQQLPVLGVERQWAFAGFGEGEGVGGADEVPVRVGGVDGEPGVGAR